MQTENDVIWVDFYRNSVVTDRYSAALTPEELARLNDMTDDEKREFLGSELVHFEHSDETESAPIGETYLSEEEACSAADRLSGADVPAPFNPEPRTRFVRAFTHVNALVAFTARVPEDVFEELKAGPREKIADFFDSRDAWDYDVESELYEYGRIGPMIRDEDYLELEGDAGVE